MSLIDLNAWLVMNGFRIAPNPLGNAGGCEWYAYRRSNIPARECETNDGKPAQIIVYPCQLEIHGRLHESVEIELCGEANGVWWKLRAYALSPESVKVKLPEIETSLVAAWNALIPAENSAQPERT